MSENERLNEFFAYVKKVGGEEHLSAEGMQKFHEWQASKDSAPGGMSKSIIERVARAIFDVCSGDNTLPWEKVSKAQRDLHKEWAKAAIEAIFRFGKPDFIEPLYVAISGTTEVK